MQRKNDKDSGNLEGTKNKWLNNMEEGNANFGGVIDGVITMHIL